MGNDISSHKVAGLLEERRAEYFGMLPLDMTERKKNRVYDILVREVSNNENIRNCTVVSIMRSAVEAVKLGLEFTGTLAQCYLVPFGKECTLIVSYRGLMQMMRDADSTIVDIEAQCVHENDSLTVDERTLHHAYDLMGERGKTVGAYCRVTYEGGREKFEFMTRAQVEKIRAISKAKNASAWKDHWDEMARKTVVRRLAKYLKLRPEAEEVISRDDERTIDVKQHDDTERGNDGAESAVARAMANMKDGETVNMETGEVVNSEPADEEPTPDGEPSAKEQEAIRQQELAESGELFEDEKPGPQTTEEAREQLDKK